MSEYHLIHEAEVIADKMVTSEKATPEEGNWLKEYSLYGIFPYQIAKFEGSSMRKIATAFHHMILSQRIRRHTC